MSPAKGTPVLAPHPHLGEYIDVYDVDGNPIPGQGPLPIGEVHAKGLWHKTFHCWVVRNQGPGYVLLQLRGKDVCTSPGKMDISAAGHLAAGETPKEGVREVEEELGISVTENAPVYLGKRKLSTDLSGYPNREICYTALLERPEKFNEYRPQVGEVDGLFEITVPDMLKLFAKKVADVEVTGCMYENGTPLPTETRRVGIKDFTPHLPTYFLCVAIMAERYLKGERYLAI